MTNEKTVREPLFHISKRDALPWWKCWLIRIAAVFAALVLSSLLIIILVKKNPVELYASIFNGNFGSGTKTWLTFQDTAILLCIALAVTPAFKMKFWNIGAEGQVLAGCLASAACVFYIGSSVPNWLLLVIMTVCAILAGAVWAVIPAVFKAIFNTNETLFTLMMNYIATFLIAFFLNKWVKSGSGTLGILEDGHFPVIGDNPSLLTVLIVLFFAAAMFVYLKYSKHGYEIAVVGESVNTAKYAGINVKKVIIRTLVLSGALCGITGLLLVGAINHTLTTSLAGGRGFTAIMVSWLAKFNPLYMILTAFIVVFFQKGANQLASDFPTLMTKDFGDIIVGIIFLFIIGCEFFIGYAIKFRKREKKEKTAEVTE